MTEYDMIKITRCDGIAHVTLDRPQARNALNLRMCHELHRAFADLDMDANVRVIILDANGPVFCAGADLKERNGKDEIWIRQRRIAAFAAYQTIETCTKPVIAVIDGRAVGSGGEMAMACDFIVASCGASFHFPEPQWGTVGATQRLQRVIGKRRAKELLFTGRVLGVDEALALGLVSLMFDNVAQAASEIATRIASAPPLAITLTKQAIDLGEEVSLAQGIRVEMMCIDRMLSGDEWRRGIDAFAQQSE